MSLSSSERVRYSAIIDDILASGDLQTISAKQIRKGLQARIDCDISEKKNEIQSLILERFDYASSSAAVHSPSSVPKPEINGHAYHVKTEPKVKSEPPLKYSASPDDKEDDDSDVISPPKKKRKKVKVEEDDAKLAAKLQAELNATARSTRGGNEKKKKPVSRPKKEKKKSADNVKKDDDSDLELDSNGEVKEKVKKGGFHKQYNLSAPLADLVGEPTLSRPRVVKKIWEHIKAENLQEPSDKRQIRCDEKLQLVFKQDTVHMFTMNKLLGKHLYDIEE